MRTVVRVGTGSQFVKKLKRTEENRLVTVFLGFDCSSRFLAFIRLSFLQIVYFGF